ncbi:MAG: cytidine deaminase [Rikenellaceae bacterium]
MDQLFTFTYHRYDSFLEIPTPDMALIKEAIGATKRSSAPYSNFRVGAAARLRSGKIIYGSNFESEVYPAGICAERSLLFSTAANNPDNPIEAIAIASMPDSRECTPCGLCRQSLLDTERRQGSPIKVIMCSGSTATVVESAEMLLPFSFVL